jgi:flagellar FliJ protein
MKKFKFRLDGLKKLRQFREHQTKIEIGMLNKEIESVKMAISKCHSDLDESYESLHQVVKSGANGRELQFYSFFNQGKRANIDQLENELHNLKAKHEKKMEVLLERRGESKVIQQLKDKEEASYKKEIDKKQEQERQDLYLITRSKNEN